MSGYMPCATFDFTCAKDRIPHFDDLINWLQENCKKWVFQLERGEQNGYEHYQGRISLRKKIDNTELRIKKLFDDYPFNFNRMTPTVKENQKNDFYVTKKDTRIEGPWNDTMFSKKSEETYIPSQYKQYIDNLLPFQKTIIHVSNTTFEYRKCNIVIDLDGCRGKSIVAALSELMYGSIDLPPLNDFDEIIQIMFCECKSAETRYVPSVFFDLPRAMDKSRLYGIFSSFEQIKKGKLYDKRYKYQKWWIDSPHIWMFSNWEVNTKMLSTDRWVFWTIDKKNELVPYVQKEEVQFQIQLDKDPVE